MKRILITGGSGFLGRELALKLKNNYLEEIEYLKKSLDILQKYDILVS